MKSRGTGLTPNRMPGEWEKTTLEMTKESPQGPAKTGRPESRSMGAFPSTVTDSIAQAPGGFIGQIIAGRPGMALQRAKPGDDTNVSGSTTGFSASGSGRAPTSGSTQSGTGGYPGMM